MLIAKPHQTLLIRSYIGLLIECFKAMKQFLALILLLGSSIAYSQHAFVNVNIHPTVSVETEDVSLSCTESNKTLHAILKFETFIVPHGELLKFEIRNYKKDQTYAVSYNDHIKTNLSSDRPYILIYPKRGTQKQVFELFAQSHNDQLPFDCRNMNEFVRLSTEPM